MKRKAVALLLAVTLTVPNTGIPALAAHTERSVKAEQNTAPAQSVVTEAYAEEDPSSSESILETQTEQDTTVPQTESTDQTDTPKAQNIIPQTEDAPASYDSSAPADLSLQTELPAASVMNVDFSDRLGTDHSETANSYRTIGNPVITDSSELHKPIANFDGSSAYIYPFDAAKYNKITNAVSIECMFKYNSLPSGEHDIFSNQQSGGIGLGLDGGKLTFFAHVGGSYRQPAAAIQAGQWVHAIGVVDGESVKLYVNGELAGEIAAAGPVKFTSNTNNCF
ncbi:LamG-like jellyroll fold domain-containing protein [uncultured Robinsoniella sp.]|uniref:LamG-like jellyroll fold domain-containing protein n=1 Tax=Robinsoniella sp. TaxID=2496533 RepID=UPI00374EF93C